MTHHDVQNRLQNQFAAEALTHLDSLYAVALRLTRNGADANDLVQDTFLKAYRAWDRFEVGTNMRAWMVRILTNTFINKYRRNRRERDVFEGSDAEPVGHGVMSREAMRAMEDPDGNAMRGMIAAEIQAALDELSDEHRMMIVLADLEELSYKEIADIVGCPIGTVMSRLHRARKQLQSRLINQAVELGIIAAPSASEPAAVTESGEYAAVVSLAAYRKAS